MSTYLHALLVILLGSTCLGLLIAACMGLGTRKAARQAEDEWLSGEPPTSLEAQRRGYCGARCPSCHSLRLVEMETGYQCGACNNTAM